MNSSREGGAPFGSMSFYVLFAAALGCRSARAFGRVEEILLIVLRGAKAPLLHPRAPHRVLLRRTALSLSLAKAR